MKFKYQLIYFSQKSPLHLHIFKGEEMQVKVSYCQLNLPSRRCLQNEPAVTLRGRGPFQFEVFQDFKCKCHRPLYAHQSWQDGPYDYVEYSCGKVRPLLLA